MSNSFKAVITCKCPRCRKGNLFVPLSVKNLFSMKSSCEVCGHVYELEPGFFYGSMYVSYGVAVAFAVSLFVLAFLIMGKQSPFFYIGVICTGLVLFTPVCFRLSRSLWVNMFTSFDKNA
jgi:uncharacterized protein (DUF983 family)